MFTHELHLIRSHILQYKSLLSDFQESVVFVRDTPNPAMDASYLDQEHLVLCRERLAKECDALLSEIERLQMARNMLDSRLTNVMNLVSKNVGYRYELY